MPIQLPAETQQRMAESLRRYLAEEWEMEEVGELRPRLLLEFCLREICPTVYNLAIADAQAFLLGKVDDLEGSCHEPEFGYWKRSR